MFEPGSEHKRVPALTLAEIRQRVESTDVFTSQEAEELLTGLEEHGKNITNIYAQREIESLREQIQAKTSPEVTSQLVPAQENSDESNQVEVAAETKNESLGGDSEKFIADIDSRLQKIEANVSLIKKLGLDKDLKSEFDLDIKTLILSRIKKFQDDSQLPEGEKSALIDAQIEKINQLRDKLFAGSPTVTSGEKIQPTLKRIDVNNWSVNDLPSQLQNSLQKIEASVNDAHQNLSTLDQNQIQELVFDLSDQLAMVDALLSPGGPIYREFEDPGVVVNVVRNKFIRKSHRPGEVTAENVLEELGKRASELEKLEQERAVLVENQAREQATQVIIDRLNLLSTDPNSIAEFNNVRIAMNAAAALTAGGDPQVVIDQLEVSINALRGYDLSPLIQAASPALMQSEIEKVNKVKDQLLADAGGAKQALVEQKENQEKEATKKDRAWQRILEAWGQVFKSEKLTKDQTANDARVNAPYTGDNIETAGIFPLLHEFFPEKVKAFEALRNLHDAFSNTAGTDVFKQLIWFNPVEARVKAAGHATFKDLKDFRSELEKPQTELNAIGIFNRVEELFAGNVEYYVVPGERKTVPAGTPGADKKNFNFGRDGNPNEKEQREGNLTLEEILESEFPDVPKPILTGVQYAIIIGELRLKYFRRYYSNYTKSPDPTFNVSAIFAHSPMDVISYNVRSGGTVKPEHRLLLQILRLPAQGPVFVEPVLNKNDNPMLIKEKNQNTKEPAEFLPMEVSDPKEKAYPQNTYRALGNKNMREVLEVRLMQDKALTTSYRDFEPIQLKEDMTILPYFWDVIYGDKYGPLTYEEYRQSLEAWLEFIKYIQSPRPITDKKFINEAVKDAVKKISPMKGLFALFKGTAEAEEEGSQFKKLIGQMLLRYIKNIFDQYMVGAKYGVLNTVSKTIFEGGLLSKDRKILTKRNYFLEQIIFEVERMETLDSVIKKDVLGKLDDYLHSASDLIFDNLFSEAKGNVLSYLTPTEAGRRNRLIEAYLADPTEEEKKSTH